jgi:hypothetical protein
MLSSGVSICAARSLEELNWHNQFCIPGDVMLRE